MGVELGTVPHLRFPRIFTELRKMSYCQKEELRRFRSRDEPEYE